MVLDVAGSSVAVAATARVRTVMMDLANILRFGNDCFANEWIVRCCEGIGDFG